MKRLLLCAFAALAAAGSAGAATFGLDCVGGTAQACGVGEAALSVDVVDAGGDQVTLTFHNADTGTSVLAAVYFDDIDPDPARLIGKASVPKGADVRFQKGGKPKDLPFATGFGDDIRFTAKRPRHTSGLGGGETMTMTLTLRDGVTYADVIAALASGGLRIGVYLVDTNPNCLGDDVGPGCEDGSGAASFVNQPVPEPGAALLGGVACLGLALLGRRR